MVLKELDGNIKFEEVNMDWCPWVQIHYLPLGLMNEKIRVFLRDSLRDVKEVETDDEQIAWGRHLLLTPILSGFIWIFHEFR